MQASAMKACFQIAECSLFYVKTVQARAMKACFQIAECSLFYSKTVQARAMKACFLIVERSLFYSKTVQASAMILCFSDCLIRSGMYKKRLRGRSVPPHLPFRPECAGVCVSLLRSPVSVCRAVLFTDAGFLHSVLHLLADILRYGVDVHHVVHCVGNDEVLRHIPYAFIVTGFAP